MSATDALISAIVSIVLVGAAFVGVDAVTLVVVILVAVATLELAAAINRSGGHLPAYLLAAAVGLIPLMVRARAEAGILEGSALAVLLMGGFLIFGRARKEVTASLGLSVFGMVTIGCFASFLILLSNEAAPDLIALLVVLVTIAVAGAWAGGVKWGSLGAYLTAAVATIVVAAVSSWVLESGLRIPELLIVGVVVAGATSLGSMIDAMLRDQLDGGSLGLASRALQPLSLAAPAFYYAVKLYLS